MTNQADSQSDLQGALNGALTLNGWQASLLRFALKELEGKPSRTPKATKKRRRASKGSGRKKRSAD